MITVKELKEELDKFPDDALCYAYEGEVTGLVINYDNQQRIIPCAEWDESKE